MTFCHHIQADLLPIKTSRDVYLYEKILWFFKQLALLQNGKKSTNKTIHVIHGTKPYMLFIYLIVQKKTSGNCQISYKQYSTWHTHAKVYIRIKIICKQWNIMRKCGIRVQLKEVEEDYVVYELRFGSIWRSTCTECEALMTWSTQMTADTSSIIATNYFFKSKYVALVSETLLSISWEFQSLQNTRTISVLHFVEDARLIVSPH